MAITSALQADDAGSIPAAAQVKVFQSAMMGKHGVTERRLRFECSSFLQNCCAEIPTFGQAIIHKHSAFIPINCGCFVG
ncbi:TPA: hypothetical protein JQR11_004472 [Shigella flexneri]|nr:hypothetical protein [Shigella flexneri]EFY6017357.1 hypothetical protein [Shigella flexneri]HAY5394808.1 hypothetical protein [Shigella flexneri]HBB4073049.1 hypothetical protein [Shigella flexneri]